MTIKQELIITVVIIFLIKLKVQVLVMTIMIIMDMIMISVADPHSALVSGYGSGSSIFDNADPNPDPGF